MYEEEQPPAEVDAKATAPGAVTVTVNVDQWLNGSLEDVVVQSLTAHITGRLSATIEKAVKAAVDTKIMDLVNGKFAELAEARVIEFFIKAHSKTDAWGNVKGEPVSIQDLLLVKFDQYMDEKVDGKGRKSTYSGDNKLTRAQWMLNTLAHDGLKAAVEQTVADISAKAKEQIQANVTRYITEQLTPNIEVPKLPATKA